MIAFIETCNGLPGPEDLDGDAAVGARPVELAEEDPLPGPEDEVALVDQDRQGRPESRGLPVAVAVPLAVAVERLPPGNQVLELGQEIVRDVGVGVLVDCQPGRRVQALEEGGAFPDAPLPDDGAKPVRDVDHLVSAL